MFGSVDISDHGTLAGLTDDDHPQYLLIDGTRAMTGALTLADQVDALTSGDYPMQLKSGELTATNDSFIFDTSVSHTTGKLFDWKNNNTSRLAIDGEGEMTHNVAKSSGPCFIQNYTPTDTFGVSSGFELSYTNSLLGEFTAFDVTLTAGLADASLAWCTVKGEATAGLNVVSTSLLGFEGISLTNDSVFVNESTFIDIIADHPVGLTDKSRLIRASMRGTNPFANFLEFENKDGPGFIIDSKLNTIQSGAYITPRGTFGNSLNLLQSTEDFTDAVWARTNMAITGNAGSAPDGTPLSADRISFLSAAGKILQERTDFSNLANRTFSFSGWVKHVVGASGYNISITTSAGENASPVKAVTSPTGEWTYVSFTSTFGAGTASASTLVIRISGSTLGTDLDVWGFSLTETTSKVPYLSNSSYTQDSSMRGGNINGVLLVQGDKTPAGVYVTETAGQGSNDLFQINADDASKTTQWSVDSNFDLNISDANDLVLGTTTGTKIGTATNQKLGFFNATPVVQPAAYTVTNPSTDRAFDVDSTSVNELAAVLGTVIADLQALGLLG